MDDPVLVRIAGEFPDVQNILDLDIVTELGGDAGVDADTFCIGCSDSRGTSIYLW